MQSSHRADIPRADAVGQESPGDGVASGYLAAAARLPWDQGCVSQVWQRASKRVWPIVQARILQHTKDLEKPKHLCFIFPSLKGKEFNVFFCLFHPQQLQTQFPGHTPFSCFNCMCVWGFARRTLQAAEPTWTSLSPPFHLRVLPGWC